MLGQTASPIIQEKAMRVLQVKGMALVEIRPHLIESVKKQLYLTSYGDNPFSVALYKETNKPNQIWIPRNCVRSSGVQVTGNWGPINVTSKIILKPDQVKLVTGFENACKSDYPYGGIIKAVTGCVDHDTEFLTPFGWRPIGMYRQGDLVAQYNPDGTTDFVYPQNYIKLPEKYLWEFKTKYGLNQCLSLEHIVVYIYQDGYLKTLPFEQVKKRHEHCDRGFYGKFITTFQPPERSGLTLTEDELRLQVAVIADSHLAGNLAWFNLKKSRKVTRLTSLLNRANIPFKMTHKQNGYTLIRCTPPMKVKEFDEQFYNCSLAQLQIINDEVLYWDGNQENIFTTTNKKSADFIQYVFTSCGYRASLAEKIRLDKGHIEFTVIRSRHTHITMRSSATPVKIKPYHTRDGYKYCFTVPSGMLVLRRKGCIFVTGNSGKTVMGIELITRLNMPTLIVVPLDRLVQQWIHGSEGRGGLLRLTNLKEKDIGIIQGPRCEVVNKKVVIAMIHTLAQKKLPEWVYEAFGFIINDEVHTTAAETFSTTLPMFNRKINLGLSATPRRKDGMEKVFTYHIGPIVSESKKMELIPKILRIAYSGSDTGQGGCVYAGKIQLGRYINRVYVSTQRNKYLCQITEMAYRKGRQILVLSDRVDHLNILKSGLVALGIPDKEIGIFTSKIKEADRKVICGTYGSIGMGVDIPRLDTVVMATPRVDVEQLVGRILRVMEGKKDPLVIDVEDTASSIMTGWAKARDKWYRSIGATVQTWTN